MKSNILIFMIGFVIALIGGYFIFDDPNASTMTAPNEQNNETDNETEDVAEEGEEAQADSIPSEAEALSRNNCLSCHAVESLAAPGGTTGPDLSNSYNDVEGKHGKDLDSFLQEPTSAVMSTVIEGNPLSEEERAAIIEALKIAAER